MNEKVTQMVSLLFKDTAPSEEEQRLQEEVLNAFYEKPVQTIRMSKNRLAVFPK